MMSGKKFSSLFVFTLLSSLHLTSCSQFDEEVKFLLDKAKSKIKTLSLPSMGGTIGCILVDIPNSFEKKKWIRFKGILESENISSYLFHITTEKQRDDLIFVAELLSHAIKEAEEQDKAGYSSFTNRLINSNISHISNSGGKALFILKGLGNITGFFKGIAALNVAFWINFFKWFMIQDKQADNRNYVSWIKHVMEGKTGTIFANHKIEMFFLGVGAWYVLGYPRWQAYKYCSFVEQRSKAFTSANCQLA